MEQLCNSFTFSSYLSGSTLQHEGMWDEDDTQRVEQLGTTDIQSARKILKDGQLFIIRDGKTYNVMGTVVK